MSGTFPVSRGLRGKAALRVPHFLSRAQGWSRFGDGSHGRVRNTLIAKEFADADDHQPC